MRREVERMLAASPQSVVVWEIEAYLARTRRDIDTKYDYRYSQLIWVFARLISEGWLNEDDLAGLAPAKVAALRTVRGLAGS